MRIKNFIHNFGNKRWWPALAYTSIYRGGKTSGYLKNNTEQTLRVSSHRWNFEGLSPSLAFRYEMDSRPPPAGPLYDPQSVFA